MANMWNIAAHYNNNEPKKDGKCIALEKLQHKMYKEIKREYINI